MLQHDTQSELRFGATTWKHVTTQKPIYISQEIPTAGNPIIIREKSQLQNDCHKLTDSNTKVREGNDIKKSFDINEFQGKKYKQSLKPPGWAFHFQKSDWYIKQFNSRGLCLT